MLKLGEIRAHVVSDGLFALDGGAMFGVVPRVLWEKTDPPDEKNRVALGLNCVLVETAGRRVLVDTGMGDKWSEKERALYRLDRSTSLASSLAGLGLGPEDVDVVVNTHLHFDHAGGNTRRDHGALRPACPRARYLVQRGEWEDACAPHERNRASYRDENYRPLQEAGVLDLLDGEVEVAPGVRVVPVGGHTAHHQAVFVEGGGETLFIPTDLVPTTSHLPLPFIMSYDSFPVGTLEAKRRLLARAAEEGWWVLFYHDPRRPLGKLEKQDDRFVLREAAA